MNRTHDALVKDYLADGLIGHVSRDSTAIVGREKPVKKIKNSRNHVKEAVPLKANIENRLPKNDLIVKFVSPQRKPSRSCLPTSSISSMIIF